MRPIDATELLEDMMKADVSSREKIAAIRRLSNEYMQKSEHYRRMALAYSTAADSIKLIMEEGDKYAES